jgi:hypothetical protein
MHCARCNSSLMICRISAYTCSHHHNIRHIIILRRWRHQTRICKYTASTQGTVLTQMPPALGPTDHISRVYIDIRLVVGCTVLPILKHVLFWFTNAHYMGAFRTPRVHAYSAWLYARACTDAIKCFREIIPPRS